MKGVKGFLLIVFILLIIPVFFVECSSKSELLQKTWIGYGGMLTYQFKANHEVIIKSLFDSTESRWRIHKNCIVIGNRNSQNKDTLEIKKLTEEILILDVASPRNTVIKKFVPYVLNEKKFDLTKVLGIISNNRFVVSIDSGNYSYEIEFNSNGKYKINQEEDELFNWRITEFSSNIFLIMNNKLNFNQYFRVDGVDNKNIEFSLYDSSNDSTFILNLDFINIDP